MSRLTETRAFVVASVTRLPSRRMAPWVGSRKPAMQFARVVLPEPLSPTTAIKGPDQRAAANRNKRKLPAFRANRGCRELQPDAWVWRQAFTRVLTRAARLGTQRLRRHRRCRP